jgi:hypothetical protein
MARSATQPHGDRAARRPVLTTIIALGCVISLAQLTGVLAVFTDRATTGTNTFPSADEARAADLQIANGTQGAGNTMTCDTFVEDLATGLIDVGPTVRTGSWGTSSVCLKNNGSMTVSVTASAIDLVDTDDDCTGDEASADATCGGDLAGELTPYLSVRETDFSCEDTSAFVQTQPASLASMSSQSVALFSLAPGATRCLSFGITYAATEIEAVASQSDTATWRFAFDGATA